MMGKWLAAVILAGGASLATIAARAAPPAPELPAGEFDAIHVHRLVYAGNHDYFRSQEYIAGHDWYVPTLNGVVRSETNCGYYDKIQPRNGWRRNDWTVAELVEYPSARR